MKIEPELNIAFTHGELCVRGGAERKMLLIARHLSKLSDVNIVIYALKFEPEKTFTEYLEGLSIKEIGGRGLTGKFTGVLKMAAAAKNSDIIHAHNHPGQFAAVISKWLKKKPVIWFANEPLLYVEGTLRRNPFWKVAVLRFIEKLILPSIDIIAANSQNTRDNIKNALNRDSVVIYSGIDTDFLKPGERKTQNERPAIITVSRLEKEKNVDLILRLAENLKECDFVIAGSGPEENTLRQVIGEKSLTNARLAISPSENEKVELYRGSDIFVLTNPDEPLGISVVEAMSCGLPVVAFDSGGARETVVNDETGFLVETEEEFKKRVNQLAENPELRKQMGKKGRQRVIENFSLKQMINKTLVLYKQLLGRYGKGEQAALLKET